MQLLINLLAGAYLGALEAAARALALYAVPLLGVCATISFYREYGTVVMQGGGVGDALASFMLLILGLGGYYWMLTNLWVLGQAAFDTFAGWGMLGGGNGLTSEQLRNPGFILDIGLKIAFPLAEQATWYEKVWQGLNMAFAPSEWILVLTILAAFAAIAVHHLVMLIEFYLALMCGAVLLPWGAWRTTAALAEFSLGWLTGALIRALVSCTMLGLSSPLFQQLRLLPAATGGVFDVMTYVQMLTPVVGSFIFAVLCWVIPARAARMAGQASLGLTGSTIASGAMTIGRFVTMGGNLARAGAGVIRGTSSLLGGRT